MPLSSGNKEPDDSQTWELAERCLLPIAFSHAVAVILATLLNVLGISQTSSFVLFLLLLIISIGATLFYHNLKVCYLRYTRFMRYIKFKILLFYIIATIFNVNHELYHRILLLNLF